MSKKTNKVDAEKEALLKIIEEQSELIKSLLEALANQPVPPYSPPITPWTPPYNPYPGGTNPYPYGAPIIWCAVSRQM